jgi:hypothetical protein
VAVGVAAVVRGVDGRGSRLSGAGATAAMMGGSKGEEPPSWGWWGFEHDEEACGAIEKLEIDWVGGSV